MLTAKHKPGAVERDSRPIVLKVKWLARRHLPLTIFNGRYIAVVTQAARVWPMAAQRHYQSIAPLRQNNFQEYGARPTR